jgi:cytochrome b6-f complex iron-sulfur subunit
LIRKGALLSCAPLALEGCARFVSPERTLAAAAPADGNVTVPLSAAPELQRSGGAVVVQPAGFGSYLLVNSGTGFFALRAECPHAGCLLTWVPEDREAECPCHGSRFAGDGKLLNPPARSDIAHYPVDSPDAQRNVIIHLFAGDGVFKQPVRDGQFSFAVADYPALQSVGGAVSGQPDGFPGPLVITRIAATGTDAVAAISAVCSHLGCTVLPAPCAPGPGCAAGSLLQCPCHGSQFDLAGGFIQGPAGTGLLRYTASFDGAIVTVSTQPMP